MVITAILLFLVIIGYLFLYLNEMFYLFNLMQFDWIAGVIFTIPVLVTIIRLNTSKSFKMFEKKPYGKELVLFLRRDGLVEPFWASRPFHGESFLDVPQVGLIHDLGKGSVYRLGDKNIRFALENVNHTPMPKYGTFTSFLYKIGFNNMKQVQQAILNGMHEEVVESIPEQETDIDILVDNILEDNKDVKFDTRTGKRKIKFSYRRRNS